MALTRPMVPTWTMSSIGSLRVLNRRAANLTRVRFSSIRVLRAYWYSCVPSSNSARRANSTFDMARASGPVVLRGSDRSSSGNSSAPWREGAGSMASGVCGAVPAARAVDERLDGIGGSPFRTATNSRRAAASQYEGAVQAPAALPRTPRRRISRAVRKAWKSLAITVQR